MLDNGNTVNFLLSVKTRAVSVHVIQVLVSVLGHGFRSLKRV